MTEVVVVVGPGQIGQAIARRVGIGKHVLLADLHAQNAAAAAKVLSDAGYEVSTATVDVSSRENVEALVGQATELGEVTRFVHAAGVSPSQASPETVLKVDLYGTALLLESFGRVIARGGSGVVIASQSGHRLPPLAADQNKALATAPVEELLGLPFLQPGQVKDFSACLPARQAWERAARDGRGRALGPKGSRINTISPGIVMTPLAKDELSGPRGEGYRLMIEGSPVGRAATPDEVGAVAALLMGPEGGFISGSDFLMDGGVTAAYWFGAVAEVR